MLGDGLPDASVVQRDCRVPAISMGILNCCMEGEGYEGHTTSSNVNWIMMKQTVSHASGQCIGFNMEGGAGLIRHFYFYRALVTRFSSAKSGLHSADKLVWLLARWKAVYHFNTND